VAEGGEVKKKRPRHRLTTVVGPYTVESSVVREHPYNNSDSSLSLLIRTSVTGNTQSFTPTGGSKVTHEIPKIGDETTYKNSVSVISWLPDVHAKAVAVVSDSVEEWVRWLTPEMLFEAELYEEYE
jgi:hypothetical protein